MSVDATDLVAGATREPRDVGPLTRTDFVRYQGASGDFNPIHHDDPFAQRAGYPSVFSVGMLQAGILATYATDWLGAENVRRFGVRFSAQVWPGDTLTCNGTVVRTYDDEDDDGQAKVDVELSCVRQTGEVAVEGWATFAVSRSAAAR